MVSLRKPGKFSLHKNTHLFPDLFNNTALPPTFSGALIIVNISAYWLFFSLYSQSVLKVQFEEKFHNKDPFDPKVSLKLQFVVDIRTNARARAADAGRAPVLQRKSANLRAHGIGSTAYIAHTGVVWRIFLWWSQKFYDLILSKVGYLFRSTYQCYS